MNIEEYKKRPIPNLEKTRILKRAYRNKPIMVSGQAEFADIRDYGLKGDNYYFSLNPRPEAAIFGLFLRKEVIKRLIKVNEELNLAGCELYFFDCYRPIELQNYFYDYWAPKEIRKQHPNWESSKIEYELNKYWARGTEVGQCIDPQSPPPHSTGAAFDLSIKKINTGLMEMGSDFDEMSRRSYTDYYESNEYEEARANRRLLYWLLSEYGFVNNPTEWWHYSYGDQMWAALKQKATALYSNINIH